MTKTKCPHSDVQFCPLYQAAHTGSKHGCDDGQLGGGECAVTRGHSYEAHVQALIVESAGMVEQLKWREDAVRAKSQRTNNMRAFGLH
ncbi:hypothetical protein LJR231_001542 [Phyllobacterium sp. LjRoot231]|uniref:hypothetical protein n=1 Tax=Phyllobacterium sp. LjRoot231 TaxID=3342289 RepID=UPI003ECDFDAF